MTLILALAASDGIVLASDGQATYELAGQKIRGVSTKLRCPWNHVAWGASGAMAVSQYIEHRFVDVYSDPNSFDKDKISLIRKRTTECVAKQVRALVNEKYIPPPSKDSPDIGALFAGYGTDGPFIIEVHRNLLDTDHIDVGYGAIGSGEIFPYIAMASLAHFDMRKRSLAEAKILAYRVLDDAIRAAALGLGPPIQMVEIPVPPGVARLLDDGDLAIINDKVVEWRLAESDTLSTVVGITMTSAAGSITTP